MTPDFRRYLEARCQECQRKRVEYAAAQACEWWEPKRGLPEGVNEYTRIMVAFDQFMARVTIEVLIDSLRTDPAFVAAGRTHKEK